MEERLFSNIGTQIKKVAIWGFYIECIAVLIGALAAAIAWNDGESILIFLGTIIVGGGAALFTAMLLYGLGELIEKMTENEKNTKKTVELLKAMAEHQGVVIQEEQPTYQQQYYAQQQYYPPQQQYYAPQQGYPSQPMYQAPVYQQPAQPAPVQTSAPKEKLPAEENPVEAIISDGEKICPKCNRMQKIQRTVCWNCGQKFSN